MIIVITGVMAAGKSTVAQRLAERLPRSAHVRGDTFRRMIVSGREELMPDATRAAEEQYCGHDGRWRAGPAGGTG